MLVFLEKHEGADGLRRLGEKESLREPWGLRGLEVIRILGLAKSQILQNGGSIVLADL